MSRGNLELFDTRVAEIVSGELWGVKGQMLTLPNDERVEVAIKSCIPEPRDKLVLIGLARYENGVVSGEAHTQPIISQSQFWLDGHNHAKALCANFERRGNRFPPAQESARNIARLRDEGALGLGCALMRLMIDVGAPIYDFRNPRGRRIVERLQGGNARAPLFLNAALRHAIAPAAG